MSSEVALAYDLLGVQPEDRSLADNCEVGEAKPFTRAQAGLLIAKLHAQRILDEIVTPYCGAKCIVFEVHHHVDLNEVFGFVGLESEHEDFSDETRTEYYGRKYCENIRNQLDVRIVCEARKLVASVA